MEKKTSQKWYDQMYPNQEVKLIYPDGWDVTNLFYSYYKEEITEVEFKKRLLESRCSIYHDNVKEKKKEYTRKEVVKIIDELLQYGDQVIDSITNEDPKMDAEDLLEMVEEGMEKDPYDQQDTMMRNEGEINPDR